MKSLKVNLQYFSTAKSVCCDNIATRAAVSPAKIYYHANILGSKTYTTHADNTVASWQEYDVWGVPQAAGARSQDLGDRGTNGDLNLTAVAVRAQYTNHDYDVVLGLYYAKARMYDPVVHRFTGRDVARSGRNWYGYVNDNPATYTDPLGLSPVAEINGKTINNASVQTTGNYGDLADICRAVGGTYYFNVAENAAVYKFWSDNNNANIYGNAAAGTNYVLIAWFDSSNNGAYATRVELNIVLPTGEYRAVTNRSDKMLRMLNNSYFYIENGQVQAKISTMANIVGTGVNDVFFDEDPEAELATLGRGVFGGISGDGKYYYGGFQNWLSEDYYKKGGCGPTAAANSLSYLALNNEYFSKLFDYSEDELTKSNFTKYMNEVVEYVKPIRLPDQILNGTLGIPTLEKFITGAQKFAYEKGVDLIGNAYNKSLFGSYKEVVEFVKEGLRRNSPVALLMHYNVNAELASYNWHWMTISNIRYNRQIHDYEIIISTWGEKRILPFRKVWEGASYAGLVYFE